MSNWITILCPTSIHLLLSLSLLYLIVSSIPYYSHHYSSTFASQLWSSLSPTYNRIRLIGIDRSTALYNKDWTWLKILFSSALPENEETAFEEQFKYLIVTSNVLNDISAQQTVASLTSNTIPNNNIPTITTYTGSLLANALSMHYGVIAIVTIFQVALIGFTFINFIGALYFHWSHPSYSILLFVQAILLGVVFTAYRKLRYTKIRMTYTRLLQHLRKIIHVTRISDRLIDLLVEKIHDVETISNGHTLVPTYSALEHPQSHLSPQTLRMKNMARSTLAPYLKSVTRILQMSIPLTHPVNFATLRGLYNVKELFSSSHPHVSSSSDIEYDTCPFDYEHLHYMVYMIRSRRQEWYLRLLALDMMTLGHDSAQQDYEYLLATVECMMVDMEQQTELVTENMKTALDSDLYDDPVYSINDKSMDKGTRTILNNLALLETHIRNLQAKIILCRHDTRDASLDKEIDYSLDRMRTRFTNMEYDMTSLLDHWDENKHTLLTIINNRRKPTLPSPPSSPARIISKRESIRRSFTNAKTSFASIPSNSLCGTSSPPQQQSSISPSLSSLQQQPLTSTSPSSSTSSSVSSALSLSSVSVPLVFSTHSDIQSQTINASHLDQPRRQSWITTDTSASFLENKRTYSLQTKQKLQEKFTQYESLPSSQELPSDII